MTQLNALAGVVDPGEVDVEGGLDDAENDRDGVGFAHVGVEFADDPVEDIEAPVGPECYKVVGVEDGGDRCLAEEKELGEDADGLEDYGEGPAELGRG